MNNSVSVLLASYNGGKYIKEQISSILSELKENDELIVSDDGSTDNTVEIVKSFGDNRIIIVDGPKTGFVNNFINAFHYSHNEIIFFSDQDDVWISGKRDKVVAAFTDGINLVKHDAIIVDENLNEINSSYNELRGANTSFIKNFLKNTFTGCCMAVRREWLIKLLPVPKDVYHDWWIGVFSCKYRCAKIIDDKLLLYRRHGENVSEMKPSSIIHRIKKRIYLWKEISKVKF